jgi:phytoene dehydrogenase-like protein
MSRVDAVVIGSGPNGLAAAVWLARAGRSVTVLEADHTIGGGTRSAQLTLPGFMHDVCSAIHPFGRISAALAPLDLERHGLRWIEPPAVFGHPLDDGTAVIVERSLDETAARLGADGNAYRRLLRGLVSHSDSLLPDLLAPFHVPVLHPWRALRMAGFGIEALRSADSVARRFHTRAARALWAGAAAHAILPFTERVSAATALVMAATAHVDGWPFPAAGAARVADALAAELRALGGTLETGRRIDSLAELPEHSVALFDVAPGALERICGDALPGGYRQRLLRYRHGPGVFKLDLALDGPIPWRAPELARTGTVHVGGTYEEIAAAEAEVHGGRPAEKPFVLLAQQSLFDPSRAPAGRHTVWAYSHVPNSWGGDETAKILNQVERFAPGFRDRILAVHATGPAQLEAQNPNYVGGDIACGRLGLGQLFTRPSLRLFDPYSTPNPHIFICSAATPPGPGVHGMSGYHAANSALRRLR